MAADVVLKIDADTQAFIGKLVQAAAAQKKLVDGAKDHGDALGKVGEYAGGVARHFVSMLGPLSAVGATTAAIEKTWGAWQATLDKTASQLASIESISRSIQRAGHGREAESYRQAASAANTTLDRPALAAATSAYLGGRPGATAAQLGRGIGAANLASAGGLDPTAYAGTLARLEKNPDIADPEQLAHALGRVDLLDDERTLSTINLAPKQASEVMRLFVGAKGDRHATAMVRESLEAWTKAGSPGSPADFFRTSFGTSKEAMAAPAAYAALNKKLARAKGVTAGELEAGAKAGAEDKYTGQSLQVAASTVRAEKERESHFTEAAQNRELREAGNAEEDSRHAAGAYGTYAEAYARGGAVGVVGTAIRRFVGTPTTPDPGFEMLQEMRRLNKTAEEHKDAAQAKQLNSRSKQDEH